MKSWTKLVALALCGTLTLGLSGCGGGEAEDGGSGGSSSGSGGSSGGEGADSPQAVADRMGKAAEAGDWSEMMRCLAPDARPTVLMGMLMGAEMMAQMGAAMGGDDEMSGKLAAFKEKHNIGDLEGAMEGFDPTDPASMKAAAGKALKDVDLVAAIPDLMKLLGDDANPFKGAKEVTDLKVDGDTASGKLGEEDVYFKKIDGRWYADMTMD